MSHFVGTALSFALNLLPVSVSLSRFTGAVWAGYLAAIYVTDRYLAAIYVTDRYLQVSSYYIFYRQVFTDTYLAAIYVTDRYLPSINGRRLPKTRHHNYVRFVPKIKDY